MWALLLFGFWLVLSQKFDLFHLGLGAVSSLALAFVARWLLRLPHRRPEIPLLPSFSAFPWLRFFVYLPWLLAQIFWANLHIAFVVLHPRLPIQPQLVRFKARFRHAFGQLMLANSITLTPGTVTLDVEGEDYLVHALTDTAASSVAEGSRLGDMPNAVTKVFSGSET